LVRALCIGVGGVVVVGFGWAAIRLMAPPTEQVATDVTNVEGAPTTLTIGPDEIAFELPEGWVRVTPGSGPTGAELFPDNRTIQAQFDSMLAAAEERQAVAFAFDSETGAQLFAEAVPTTLSVAYGAAVDGGRRHLMATDGLVLTTDRALTLPSSAEGHIFRYEIDDDGGPIHSIQIVVNSPDGYVVFVGQSTEAGAIDEIEAIAPTIIIS
jgi:hypothetical protein